jgi:hypothetical protein
MRRRFAMSLILVLAVGGCSASAGPVSSPSVAPTVSPSAPPTPHPTATPAPTPKPITAPAVVALLKRKDLSINATYTGSMEANGKSIQVKGVLEAASDRTRSVDEQGAGAEMQYTERIRVGSERFVRRGRGPTPWFRDTEERRGLVTLLQSLAHLDDRGQVTQGGKSLRHFAVPAAALTPQAFNLDADTISAWTPTFDLYTDGTGALVSADLALEWTQETGGGTAAQVAVTVTYAFNTRTPRITAPTSVWAKFTSDRHGYSIGHPEDVDAIDGTAIGTPFDFFRLTEDELYMVILERQSRPISLETYVEAYLRATRPYLKSDLMLDEPIEMDGRPAWLLAYHLEPDSGVELFHAVVLTIDGRDGYSITIQTPPGYEDNVVGFLEVVSLTFHLER